MNSLAGFCPFPLINKTKKSNLLLAIEDAGFASFSILLEQWHPSGSFYSLVLVTCVWLGQNIKEK